MLLFAACGGEPAPHSPREAPPREAPVEREQPEEAPQPAPQPEEEPPAPPAQQAIEGASIERAIEPVEGAASIAAMVERGRRRYVLFRWDGARVARERIAAEPGGEARLTAIDRAIGSCDDEDDYSRYDCIVRAVPDAYLAATELGEGHAWGVAIVEARGDAFVRTARRFLFAWSQDDGAALDHGAELRARDPDGDGEEELIVTLPIVPLRSDLGMTGADEAIVTHVLDASDLRTQLRVTSHYESMMMDVAGTTTSCRGAWRLVDLNGDAHDDVTIRASCTDSYQDEEAGTARDRRRSDRRDCLYDASADAWRCEGTIAAWLFSDGDSGAVVAEEPDDLGAALGDVGASFAALSAEAEDDGDEADGDEADGDEIESAGDETEHEDAADPPRAPVCVFVVDDPAPPLRVRATPSARAAVLGELPNGTELTLVARRGRWARIERPHAGWVWTENLRERCTP